MWIGPIKYVPLFSPTSTDWSVNREHLRSSGNQRLAQWPERRIPDGWIHLHSPKENHRASKLHDFGPLRFGDFFDLLHQLSQLSGSGASPRPDPLSNSVMVSPDLPRHSLDTYDPRHGDRPDGAHHHQPRPPRTF